MSQSRIVPYMFVQHAWILVDSGYGQSSNWLAFTVYKQILISMKQYANISMDFWH